MSNKSDAAGTIISYILFGLFSLGGLYATIMSYVYSFSAYKHVNLAGTVIWFVLGLFMLFWSVYFSKELIQLIKAQS